MFEKRKEISEGVVGPGGAWLFGSGDHWAPSAEAPEVTVLDVSEYKAQWAKRGHPRHLVDSPDNQIL